MKIFKNIYPFVLIVLFVGLQIPNVHAQSPDDPDSWTLNPADYQYTMTVVGVASFGCEQSIDPEDKIGAFLSEFLGGLGEFAGAQYFDTEVNGQNMAYLTLYSNINQHYVSYYLYDASEDEVIPVPYYAGVYFEDNKTLGSSDEPIPFDVDAPPSDIEIFSSLSNVSQAGDTIGETFILNPGGYAPAENISLEFVNDYNGIDNSYFNIIELGPDNYALIINELIGQSSYQVHLRAYFTDMPACSMSRIITIDMTYVNPAPVGLAEVMYEIEEDEPIGTFIGTLEAVDESENDTHTYELFDADNSFPDNQLFSIDGTSLLSNAMFDYNVQSEYLIQIEVADNEGGTATELVTVNIRPKPVIFEDEVPIANLLTPNNDGHNDFFELPDLEYFADYSLTIFNAIGNELFHVRDNYDNSWEGTSSSGAKLPSGTYYYILQDNTDNSNRHTGEIHLYRNNRF